MAASLTLSEFKKIETPGYMGEAKDEPDRFKPRMEISFPKE
jgi:hypothetical protein